MVHTFEALGVKLAVDVNSGAVHVLDDLTYRLLPLVEPPMAEHCPPELLARLPEYRTEAVEEGWQDLRELAGNGLLFVEDDYVDPAAATALQQSAPIKALCLHVSHDCNLRCQYCFASTGDFGTGRKIMDIETAKRAIDFVIQRSGSRRNIEVDFFGGEPLMAMDTVKATVAYARSIEKKAGKCFRFTITTNGVLLDDENIDYINREMSNAVLSLDGRPQVNDRMRKTVNGKGSYEVIVPKFQKLVAGRGTKDYYLRGTFTHYNLDFAEDVMHMADLGFRNVSVEPVVGEETCGYALKDEDLPVVLEQYEKLAEKLKDRADVNFFHFNVDLAQGPCVIKRLRGCGAGCEYVAVTPEGDIYPCHQFVGNPAYKIGSLSDGSFDMELSHRFSCLNIYTREECRDCWARFYCSGGCSASNLLVNGDIKKPNHVGCEMERKRLECAIALKALAAGMG
ncbi:MULTISPECIES: thioether cross-link-forming SCIFF peptide maturase [Intestinimonas]|uniref:Thioether cross-link-forming SCIFF peptide maturase n=1 Tax=Intestinimonas massiliensis (ex Afouda et al. 2020) TaxID=1673721 RepID=A0ABS9MB69_9FIRM|nr:MULTISPECIES: thioether cross-link-forming SCIFF peptide maturase [Intestinimonas]MBS6283084.1 thioether cross-link-forming SCIFF peptide maturase [Oscillospiraceae bacterium]CUQ57442.1 six-Cys-in-45 modification radical SAM protein [Flavonifractor plautii]SCJ28444.1 Anaerobic sulfatase-maturating enzyme homolog YdeM [uncultured Flavonifractor sp.]MCG4527878.1 thioether cross-link-forming SCIFF peptide maturase [Intestinimonas massiliensis (ex Afouda et al. 2020)]MCQ4807949.1 thioether cros